MPGHEFAGCKIRSFGDQIAKVLTDLQLAIRRRHPSLPAAAEACFLESWEVLRHVAEFCGKILAPSDTAADLLRETGLDTSWSSRHIEAARYAVRIQLAVYAAAIRSRIDLNGVFARTDLVREVFPTRNLYLSDLAEKLLQRFTREAKEPPNEKALLTLGPLPVVGLGRAQVCVSRLRATESAILSECDQLNTDAEEKVLLIIPPGAALSPETRSLLETRGFILGSLMPAGSDGSVTLLWNTISAAGSFAQSPVNDHLIRKEGQYWTITFAGKTIRMRDSKGLLYLSYLLSSPGRESPAIELVAAAEGRKLTPVRSSAGDILDQQAMNQYKARAAEISAEIEEARGNNDVGRVELLRGELEPLADQISAARGLGGRLRTVGDSNEQARKAVGQAITRAVEQIRKSHTPLAQHLDRHLSLGTFLSYTGEQTSWSL
jgi:hypothetical protein